MEEDWDLQAVVKSCTTTSLPDLKHDSSVFSPVSKITQNESLNLPCFPDSFQTREIFEELHQFHNPFVPKSQTISLCNGFKDQLFPKLNQSFGDFVSIASSASTSSATRKCSQSSSRSKRRKNQMKKVCQVTAEGVSSDVWSWRKYGQKPIKGSPFPRGYYKCSSSKGCLARKQVERNKSDPTMFIITYTSEHNHPVPAHRNSLAGVTRNPKPPASSSPATDESPLTTTSTENIVDDQEEEDDNTTNVGFSESAVTDDFFEGLDEFSGPVTGDFFSDHLPAIFSLPWIAGSS